MGGGSRCRGEGRTRREGGECEGDAGGEAGVRADESDVGGQRGAFGALADAGEEHGRHAGLGWIAGTVRAFAPAPGLRIPHMGWNDLTPCRAHALVAGIAAGAQAYFVHSYHFSPSDRSDVVATTDYGGELAAIVGRNNVAGTQFHPEKSQEAGLRLIANFLTWRP